MAMFSNVDVRGNAPLVTSPLANTGITPKYSNLLASGLQGVQPSGINVQPDPTQVVTPTQASGGLTSTTQQQVDNKQVDTKKTTPVDKLEVAQAMLPTIQSAGVAAQQGHVATAIGGGVGAVGGGIIGATLGGPAGAAVGAAAGGALLGGAGAAIDWFLDSSDREEARVLRRKQELQNARVARINESIAQENMKRDKMRWQWETDDRLRAEEDRRVQRQTTVLNNILQIQESRRAKMNMGRVTQPKGYFSGLQTA